MCRKVQPGTLTCDHRDIVWFAEYILQKKLGDGSSLELVRSFPTHVSVQEIFYLVSVMPGQVDPKGLLVSSGLSTSKVGIL